MICVAERIAQTLDISVTLWYNIRWVGVIVFVVRFAPPDSKRNNANLTNVRKVR